MISQAKIVRLKMNNNSRLWEICSSGWSGRRRTLVMLLLMVGELSLTTSQGCDNSNGSSSPQSEAPVNTVIPTISGISQVGNALTASTGTWTNSPTSYSYQWNAGGTVISGATSSTYTLISSEVGDTITVTVTATNSLGSTPATSNSVGPVTSGAPANTALPTISGTAQVGDTLTASTGTWTNSPTSYSYQWNAGGTAISGATSSTYTLISSEVGNTITVTVTATNSLGSASATSSSFGPVTPAGVGSVGTPFTALHTYYISPTGSDSNGGTSSSSPWLTPNHPVDCGDVIIAAPGSYSPVLQFGSVSNCPSSSGGIDGQGGIYFATLLCGGNVGTCAVTQSSCNVEYVAAGIEINNDNWAVEGWGGSMLYTTSCAGMPFEVNNGGPSNGGVSGTLHHVAYINNIAYNNANGFGADDHGNGTYGVDYWAIVGNIAQNSAGRADCHPEGCYYDSAIDMIGVANYDTAPGTHIFTDGNFMINNQQTLGGASDGEAMMADTWDALDYTQQAVIRNNLAVLSERFGFHMFYQGMSNNTPTLKIYNNTFFANDAENYTTGQGASLGEINMQSTTGSMPWNIDIYNNIAKTNWAENPGDAYDYALETGGDFTATTIGNTGANPASSQNIFKGMMTTCQGTSCDPGDDVVAQGGGSYGVNTYEDPAFNNTSDMLSNQIGVPNCNGFVNTVQCMGYNANTQTLTNPSVLYDMTPTASGTSGKGMQLPSTTCVSSDADFPAWLKGIVYLQWNSSTQTITENADLVAKPCGM